MFFILRNIDSTSIRWIGESKAVSRGHAFLASYTLSPSLSLRDWSRGSRCAGRLQCRPLPLLLPLHLLQCSLLPHGGSLVDREVPLFLLQEKPLLNSFREWSMNHHVKNRKDKSADP